MTKLALLTIGLLMFAVCQTTAKPVQGQDELDSGLRMRRSPVPQRRGKLRSQEDSNSSESGGVSSSEEDGVDTDYDDTEDTTDIAVEIFTSPAAARLNRGNRRPRGRRNRRDADSSEESEESNESR